VPTLLNYEMTASIAFCNNQLVPDPPSQFIQPLPQNYSEDTAMPQKSTRESNSFCKELISFLIKENAHAGFDAAVKDLPADLRGERPHGVSHSAYQLVEHLRIAQWDIVEYTLNPNHKSPNFPDGYWPKSPEPPHARAWDKSIASFRADRKKLVAALEKSDILAPIRHANNQSLASKTILLLDQLLSPRPTHPVTPPAQRLAGKIKMDATRRQSQLDAQSVLGKLALPESGG
jgi:DinB superfamily